MERKTLYYETSNSLSHHGIKGMKWGVRRYQNKDGTLTAAGRRRMYKDIRAERNQLENDERKRLEKKYDIVGKSNKAYEYGRKHDLDLDDGGGGSVKAGREYLKMLDDITELKERTISESKRNTRNILIEKYGEDTLVDMEKRGKRTAIIKGAGVVTALLATTAAGAAIINNIY